MKKLFITLAAVVAFAACSDNDDEPEQLPAAPTIVLQGGDIDQPIEITAEMSAKVDVKAPGTIAGFTVTIDSPFLTEDMMNSVQLSTKFDLCNPGTMDTALANLKFPCGDEVAGQTSVRYFGVGSDDCIDIS